jgi:predicted amidohydrolase YtcJ
MIHFRIACIAILLGSVQACTSEQIEVDAIVIAKRIYIGDSAFSTAEALVLSGEKILDFGTKEEILAKYQSKNQKEYEGYIYPGLIDAHSHFYGYSMTHNEVDLVGTSSMEEVVDKTLQFAQESDNPFRLNSARS